MNMTSLCVSDICVQAIWIIEDFPVRISRRANAV